MTSRPNRICRFIVYISILTISFYISATLYHYYYNINNSPVPPSSPTILPYNEFIDQKGVFLPYTGYKILQLVKKPLPSSLTELSDSLNQQEQLKLYFKLIPIHAYHITLTNLKNQSSYTDKNSQTTTIEKYIPILIKEQSKLDQEEIEIIGIAKQFLIIDKTEIRIQIEIQSDILREYQERWKNNFPDIIIEQYTSFHLTIAYQYKPIPSKEILNQLEDILKQSTTFPFDIPLDPIEISLYRDLITYTALVPDTL